MDIQYFYGFSLRDNNEDLYKFEDVPKRRSGNYYFLSNDIFRQRFRGSTSKRHVIMGIANPHFYHVLAIVSSRRQIKRIVAIDNNIEQIYHFIRLCNYILESKNRTDFLQRLFKVRFNEKARSILEKMPAGKLDRVRGGVEKDGLFKLELTLWENCSFDVDAFRETYYLDFVRNEKGLLIKAKTIGDINDYYATFVCCGRAYYELWAFTAGFGSGFLSNEKIFQRLKNILSSVPIYVIAGDVSELYNNIILSNQYEPIVFWLSNILSKYFTDKNPKILRMISDIQQWGTQREPNFPEVEIKILQDQREKMKISSIIDDRFWKKRRLSVHTNNFRKLSGYLYGFNNVEVVNVQKWIKNDAGVSKLPNTKYLYFPEFQSINEDTRFDSIILHILKGHGVTKDNYSDALRKARRMTNNLIIIEHNRESKDFRKSKIGVTADEIRDSLGKESLIDFGPGYRCKDRNLIMVYRAPEVAIEK